MHLFLDSLEYENFMGGTLRIEFGKSTDIFGANGTGKSRFKDAYSWLITGRNANDEAKFPIKDTVNTENNILPHRVKASFRRSPGEDITFEKIYKEDWSSVQGSAEKKLKGHTITYKIDGNEKPAGTYEQIMDTLIPANLLKMLSDPLYFPDKMGWEDQRRVLELMASEVTNEYVLNVISDGVKDFGDITKILDAKQTLEDRKQRLNYEIKELKKSHTPIAPKIEELTLQITNMGKINIKEVNKRIGILNAEIEKIESQINDKSAAEDQQSETARTARNTLNNLKNRNQDIESFHNNGYKTDKGKFDSEKSGLEDQITALNVTIRSKESLIKSLASKKSELDNLQTSIETRWREENEKDFPVWDDKNFICETCNRKHDNENIEETKAGLENHFIENKKKKLEGLNSEWAIVDADKKYNANLTETTTHALDSLNEKLKSLNTDLETVNQKISDQGEVKNVYDRLADDVEYQNNIIAAAKITTQLSEVQPINYDDLKADKNQFISKLDDEKRELHKVETIKSLEDRSKQLAEQERTLAEQIASYQREDLLIDEFVIAKSNIIEQTIRSKFKNVTFKMFKNNIGDPIPKPTCELWYDGKPWKALNTGSKLNAGLDVINALSKHYGIFPPLLLDNRESVHDIYEMDSQIINFFVSQPDKVLRVENSLH